MGDGLHQNAEQEISRKIIFDVLVNVFDADYELRPDIIVEASRAVAANEPMRLAESDRGDPFLDSETIDHIYKGALFIAAVVKTVKDSYDLSKSIVADIKAKNKTLQDLGESECTEIVKRTRERLLDFDDIR